MIFPCEGEAARRNTRTIEGFLSLPFLLSGFQSSRMMNYSPTGIGFGGNSSSSSSNLSALAPPFTVDRLNPNFNSSSLMQYPDSTYAAVDPFKHLWQYACPSAPGPELAIDPTADTGVHLPDSYGFSARPSVTSSGAQWTAPIPVTKIAGAFGYGADIKPYYSSHVPPLVGEDKPLVPNQSPHYNVGSTSGMNRASQLDYQSSFDLEYGPQWIDDLGFEDGMRSKKVELCGMFSSDKANVGGSCFINQLNQGGISTGARNKFKEESDFSYHRFNQLHDTEFRTGALNVGHVEGKDFGQNFAFFANDSKKPNILGSSSTYQNSHPLMLSSEMHTNFPTYQSSYASYEKCGGPNDALFTAPPSLMGSFPTVAVRPPPATNADLQQSTFSHKRAHVNNGEGVRIVDFGCSNPSNQKEIGVESSFSINQDNAETNTNLINFSKQGDGLVPSTSVKEMSSAFHSGMFDHKISSQFVPQLPDLIVSSGSAVASDNFHAINPDAVTSDFADTLNMGVDSPCWKGAPYSKISQFDVEVDNTKKKEKNFGEYHGFQQEENQYLHSLVSSDGESSVKIGHDSKNDENEYAITDGVLKLGRTLDSLCLSNEQILFDAAKCSMQVSTTTTCENVITSTGANVLRKEYASLSDCEMKDCKNEHLVDGRNAGTAQIYTSEEGNVAVHAAEKVLDSPTSHDAAPEHPKLPVPKLGMRTIINAMHNLSEVLLCSNHADSLDGENIEILKHTIRNIDSCLSNKVIKESDKSELSQPIRDTFEKPGQSCDEGTNSENHMTNQAMNSSIHLEYGSMHEGLGTYTSGKSGKKDKKLPKFSPFMDDIDTTGDDNMTKAIKKILEENFDCDEEMPSQALFFRSLWLEAEAKLCSISYKARFDRMKIQLEEAKFKAPQAAAALPVKADEGTFHKSTMHDFSISCMSGRGDGIEGESSVMERYNILKSREENLNPINLEEEHEPKMGDGEHAPSVVARLGFPKSHEGNSKSVCMEQEHDMIGGEHASSVMARVNILKSLEDDFKSVSVGKEQPEAVDGDSADWKYVMQCSGSVSKNEDFNTVQMPHFQHHVASTGLNEGRFYLPVKNGPIRSQDNSGSNNSSSDWEHVFKDDLSSKNS